MPGTKLPAVRLPPSFDEEGGVPTPVVVDLSTSSKFGFAWPSEPPPPVQAPLNSERAVSLSSSEGESDHSDAENTSGLQSQTDHSDDDSTPTVNRAPKSEHQVTTEKGPSFPRLSRAVSMPLPSRLGHLQNPRRPFHSSPPSDLPSSPISEVSPEHSQFHELSLELADSVQMMVQTLLQISPSQVFDPAKEQFSACSLSVPTPCMSAVFTSMKNLNYISANMAALCANPDSSRNLGTSDPSFVPSTSGRPSVITDDFDIGELLQSVGDTLSGAAAQAGVDLVLYHGDVGMKHVSVQGDECGVSYVLSHVVRQVIGTAHRGDSIEIGLFVGGSPSKIRDATFADATPGSEGPPLAPASPVLDPDGPLLCLFDISHNFALSDASSPDETTRGPFQPSERSPPAFNTLILQRLLRQIGASLTPNLEPKISPGRRAYELAVTMERGSPSVVNVRAVLSPEDASYQLLSGVRIAEEPSLEELAQFTETLRGKKVTLYASSRGSFAHHLTSYLTAWGLDVSHVSTESGPDGSTLQAGSSTSGTPSATGRNFRGGPLQSTPYGASLEAFGQPILHPVPPPSGGADQRPAMSNTLSFIFIDDDVTVLRERLRKLRLQQAYPLTLSRKRPSLAPHHRPRSSPHVQRAVITGSLPVVIVHFTSLANYKLVKDVIHSDLALHPGSTSAIPEIMIIPKPAGPRRFLTALHTAVTKPLVDPFFAPIATSPITTGQTSFFNFNTPDTRSPSPKSPTTTSKPSRTNSDRSTKSPKEIPGDPVTLPPPSPLSMSDSMEYFSEAVAKLGTSPSSGLVIQSPSGQPAGIFFHPKAKGKSSNVVMERERGQFLVPSDQMKATAARRTSNGKELKTPHSPMSFSSLHTASITPASVPLVDVASQESQSALVGSSKSKGKKPSSPRAEDTTAPASPRRTGPMSNNNTATKVTTPPTSPLNETANATAPRRNSRRPTAETKQPSPQAGAKGLVDANIVVPPISVLIVDDNPINQTILSTFMKKKKIKYDVAKNGEEAVQKWRTGGFHLILMDIQMPVMDGIQATKEIRMMEKMNSSSEFPLSTPRSEGPLLTPPLRTPSEAPSSSASSSPYRSSVIIVALTASSLQSDRVAALAAGCNDFLTKPVSLQWLNNKIIEWGSIKALQMWADLRPEVVKSMSTGQAAQAHNVAQRLHVPEGRTTPTGSASRSSSRPRATKSPDVPPQTFMEWASPVIGGSVPAFFSAKDDSSDSPSSDNPVSDSEPRQPILPETETEQPLNIGCDSPKQDDELFNSDENPIVATI